MAKDRLDNYIEDLKQKISNAEQHPSVKKLVSLQNDLAAAEKIQTAILAGEESVPSIGEPKQRKSRTPKHQAKMPELAPVGMAANGQPEERLE